MLLRAKLTFRMVTIVTNVTNVTNVTFCASFCFSCFLYLYIPKKSFLLPPFNKSKQSTLRPITLHQPPKIKSNKSNKSNICNI